MDLFAPIETLKGIGPKTAAILQKSGLKTVRDFLYNLPRAYENYQNVTKISDIRPGNVVIKGKIENITTRRARRRNFTITEAFICDDSGAIRAVWFNQPYRAKQCDPNKEYLFKGVYDLKNGRYQLTSPSVAAVFDVAKSDAFQPVYIAHGGLKSNDFQRLAANSRSIFANIPDLLPGIPAKTRANALFDAHFPKNEQDVQKARDYLAYEELFELVLASKLNKQESEKLQAAPIPFNLEKVKKFLQNLPFELTVAQRKAAWEIFQDMEKSTPMNRLLQGDVGSGKTMVAALAALGAAVNKTQTAILAPTAILATQHYENLKAKLEPFHITVALLTGATKQKSPLKEAIKQGKIDVIIGTHALLTDDTEFNNLGLVVIDEQHRFGVEQRQKLLLKSPKDLAPHLLTMTATPIPRSLQLTLFGDLDVSTLNEYPKGRQKITTKIISEVEQKDELYPKIVKEISQGHQIYWICPEVGETSVSREHPRPTGSGTSEARPVTTAPWNAEGRRPTGESERLPKTDVSTRTKKLHKLFPDLEIQYLHGKMKPAEKDRIMSDFAQGKIQILVSTTVVEVGVDVPNATLIIIENAENYGLAQLHQLRGRVGRGQAESACYLLTTGENPPSRRLKELENSNDGFHLAEVDLSLRGPGEIYGALQHGALNLRIANLSDAKTNAKVRHDVEKFLQTPEKMLEYKELMDNIKRYQQLTTLN